MATRAFTVEVPVLHHGGNAKSSYIVTWTGLLNGDDGAPFVSPNRADKSVQVLGTLGGTPHAFIDGTNQQAYTVTPGTSGGGTVAAPTYHVLNDPQGNPLDITTLKTEQILESVNAIRPRVTGDGTTNLTVVMLITAPLVAF
jgi:hypothetical protein